METNYLIYYFIGINVLTYLLFGIDKVKASHNQWRIPEKTLFTCSFLGGSIGAILAMKQFRHKTQKKEFKQVIGLIVLIQIVLVGFVGYQFIQGK